MSRTVSFRASEELDEYLEQEAEQRLTTKSTVVQMIVAEYFRNQIEESDESEEDDDPEESLPEETDESTSGKIGDDGDKSESEEIFEKHSENWYKPDGKKNDYAVEHPSGERGKRKYYKTASGAAKRLVEWYE